MDLRVLAVLIFALATPTAVVAQVGPCNENYTFTCDDDGDCTCISKGANPEAAWKVEEGEGIVLPPGQRLEVVPSFAPGDDSICEIAFELVVRSLGGEPLERAGAVLTAEKPFSGHGHRRHAWSDDDATSERRLHRQRVRLQMAGTATNCTLDEFRSLAVDVATYRGLGRTPVSQRSLGYTYTFENLEPGDLPPILPPDAVCSDERVTD